MFTAGRNDPCPCGSGKKYKKCCIDKQPLAFEFEKAKSSLLNLITFDEVNALSTDDIFKKLKSFGIQTDEDTFLSQIQNCFSAGDLSEYWYKTYTVTTQGRDGDYPWMAAWVLWERLSPKKVLCIEQMEGLIDKGFEALSNKNAALACDIWLEVWEAIKYRSRPEDKTFEYLDKKYKESFFINNFCQDLENELSYVGLKNPAYLEKCVVYCNEFLSLFPDEDELIIHNMRRTVIEAYIGLKAFNEAEKALEELISHYPNNPWSYIAYGDMYLWGDALIKDFQKAKAFYDKALAVATTERERLDVKERYEALEERKNSEESINSKA